MAERNPTPTPQADYAPQAKTGKKLYYNTGFIPKTGNIEGSWWDPSYYMFYFTILLIIINTVYLNIKTSGNYLGHTIIISLVLFVMTYFFTRSSSCLWAGGCEVFAIFNLIFPFISIIIIFLLEDMAIKLNNLKNIEYPKETPEQIPKPERINTEGENPEESDDESVDNDPSVDGFSNKIEPYGRYYPY